MLDALRHFLLIAEHGTFTRAARRAHLSQPALTASIHRLEQVVGARLLHRGRGGATLTAAGDALAPRARAALAAVADGLRAVAEIEGLRSGEVRLGAGATACTYLLPVVLAEFRRRHPGVSFLLREATTGQVMDALQAGELDLGVVSHASGEPWFDDHLILVAAPGVEAAGAPFVTFAKGSTTRELLDRHFPGAAVVMELGSIAAVKGNVRAGIGVALVSRHAVETDLALGRLVEVPDPSTPILRRMHVVHRGVDRLPPAAAALRLLLLEQKDAVAGAHAGRKRTRRREAGKSRGGG
jgi:DNA-binding transcriptional LysR family regulator